MMTKTSAVLLTFVLTGCGLGQALKTANAETEHYRACVRDQIAVYMAGDGAAEPTVEAATAFVIAGCQAEEETVVMAMTDLAMTLTGNLVSREEFLTNEDAELRADLHDDAAEIVADELPPR